MASGVGAHGIADGEDAEHFAFAPGVRLVADDDDRLRSRFDLRQQLLEFLGADRQLVREAMIANKVLVTRRCSPRPRPLCAL